MLRGLYQGVRNPRSHSHHADKAETADALILFINYLSGLIDQARSPFEKASFLARVFDSKFPENAQYAELLVSENLPAKDTTSWLMLTETEDLVDLTNSSSFFVSYLCVRAAMRFSASVILSQRTSRPQMTNHQSGPFVRFCLTNIGRG